MTKTMFFRAQTDKCAVTKKLTTARPPPPSLLDLRLTVICLIAVMR